MCKKKMSEKTEGVLSVVCENQRCVKEKMSEKIGGVLSVPLLIYKMIIHIDYNMAFYI